MFIAVFMLIITSFSRLVVGTNKPKFMLILILFLSLILSPS